MNRELSGVCYAFILLLLITASASAKTVYVDLLNTDARPADGTYDRPFKSWRVALQHVTSGDTIIAKHGDYRKAGREAKWGGLDFTLTLADELQSGDPHPTSTARPDVVGIYRYDPKNS